jgi:hypothetical protein
MQSLLKRSVLFQIIHGLFHRLGIKDRSTKFSIFSLSLPPEIDRK